MITNRTRAILSLANAKWRENELREEENEIASKEAMIKAERLEFEKSTKDRADVSLREYERLKKDLEHYRKEASSYKETLLKITEPLFRELKNDEVASKIIRGEFDCKVVTSEIPITAKFRVGIIYEFDENELLKR